MTSNGWHAAIVVRRDELAATGLLPEADDFPNAVFVEFGWGDRVYYPAEEVTVGMTLEAALAPTDAIMHVAGLRDSPELARQTTEVLSVRLSRRGFLRMAAAIAGAFERPDGGAARPVSRGLYPDSSFYNAHGSFHLFNTCNTWVARMLREGGAPISPSGVVTAAELMDRVRRAIGSAR